jgi:hypothetical protein
LEATRRSFNKDFLLALSADFKRHGPEAIEKVRKTQPAAYLKICALMVPREMKLEQSSRAIKAMTDEQLETALETLREIMRQRAAALAGDAASPALPAPDVIDVKPVKPRDD